MQKEFARTWTCAAPAIAFGLPIVLLVRPWIGILIFLFCVQLRVEHDEAKDQAW